MTNIFEPISIIVIGILGIWKTLEIIIWCFKRALKISKEIKESIV